MKSTYMAGRGINNGDGEVTQTIGIHAHLQSKKQNKTTTSVFMKANNIAPGAAVNEEKNGSLFPL